MPSRRTSVARPPDITSDQIDPLQKLRLAPALLNDIDIDSPRAQLADAVERRREQFGGAAVYDRR